ncbi:dockerin type I domain-containing protein [Roseivirga misakiensis]|uniref:Dockerin domain-containing protein n=1 Tax=Roseivirga misakiensis TaxID=1563681 RepID=A0A1E5T732_9BACT|nr:dockerin type I domain-containing protein [Roseivirga misakiensis]OEK07195.1 hypothetical protein BFP71_05955 [Roseivirga misakiensis]
MKLKPILLSLLFIFSIQFGLAQTAETEPNGTISQSGTQTVSTNGVITGQVCLGAGCPSTDPVDHWIITDGSSGSFIVTWSDDVVINVREYNTSARNTAPTPISLASGVGATLDASKFYTFDITFKTIASLTSYSATISGTALPDPVTAPSTLTVAATVFLEGAYNGTNLNTAINSSIPAQQPYNGVNSHSQTTSATIPANAVDWVLVEIREAASAALALNSTKVGSAAGFLMSDGTIKATDGTSNLSVSLTGNSGSDFFIVIYHRNHLPIMSASAISESGGNYTIDFTSNSANTYQTTTALASLTNNKFGMPSGDVNQDGSINSTDLSTWRTNNGAVYSYSGNGSADFNLDGEINAVDRNDFQQKNTSKTRQVPTT